MNNEKNGKKVDFDALEPIAVVDPRDVDRSLLKKHPPEYYERLNKKYFSEFPSQLWGKFAHLVTEDYINFSLQFFSPKSYTPFGFLEMSLSAAERYRRLCKGARNFQKDAEILLGVKKPNGFTLGKDIGATPKELVYESKFLKLYRYKSNNVRHAPPILFVYSYINGYYILDLAPTKSLVEHFVKAGFDVFITDWQNEKSVTLNDYINEIRTAVTIIKKIGMVKTVGGLGYCIGGVLLNIIAALYPKNFSYIINLATGMDARVGDDGMGRFAAFSDERLVDVKGYYELHGGVFPGYALTAFFDAIKPEKKAEQIYASYVRGEETELDEVLFWNSESSRDVPGPAHYQFLHEIYNKNSLAEGKMKLCGKIVTLKKITQPYCNVAARFDHIVPLPVSLRNSFLVGTPFERQKVVIVKGGHIRGVVNANLFPHLSSFAEQYSDVS